MYEKHPEFKDPNGNPKLWRFMDFTKFASMLDSNSLYFSRSDLLGDSFEGTYTMFSYNKNSEILKQVISGTSGEKFYDKIFQDQKMMHDFWKKSCYVSCWHQNDYEPYDMWKTYTQTNEAVSIQSTWKKVIESFQETSKTVHAGIVDYIDYNTDDNSGNLFRKLLTKRKNFFHESELRAIILDVPKNHIIKDEKNQNRIDWEKFPNGIKINIDLDDLIEKIVVAPNSPSWFKLLVESFCKKFNLNKPVIDSKLDEQPSPY